ncbi:polysaccharide deacetylase family protein [Nonomuraea sp. NPDC049421]|uniref:polysaccharide deacetylase family protein n=1 Tax=Nonomuraea sp. NPDC049421 TaxID=3155275 RepID=UPI0034182204
MAGRRLNPALGSAPGWPLVLYFHHVNAAVDHYTAISPDGFRRALDLVLTGFGPAVEPALVTPRFAPPPEPAVLITFDDGYRDVLTQAVPLLAEFDVRILLFCVTDRMADTDRPAPATPREDFLTWSDVAALTRMGHVAGAHTRSHVRLSELTAARARDEVGGSLADTRRMTGAAPAAFAYPYGDVPAVDPVPGDVLGFGTVRSAPLPWLQAPHHIRRTYLPSGEEDRWPELVTRWRRQWFASQ